MKKLICLILSIVIAFCFVSCKQSSESAKAVQSNETTENADDGKDKGDEVRITVLKSAETLSLGTIEGNDYINKSAGFSITGLDEKWKQSSPEQIANVFNSGVDPSTGKAYSSNSDDGSQNYLYDVMYTNSASDEVISVSLLEYSGDSGLSDEIPMSGSSDAIEGFNHTSELIYLDVAGRKTSCKKISYVKTKNIADIPDITEYELYMMSSSYRQVIKIVIVCFEGQDSVEEILKHFTKI